MAYIVPNTFTDGTAIDADDLKENIVKIASFINQGIASADISDNSIDTQHIIHPTNTTIILDKTEGKNFETGTVFGHRLEAVNKIIGTQADNIPFSQNGFIAKPYQENKSDVTGWRPVSKTGVTFYVSKSSTATIRYSGEFVSPDDHTSPDGTVNQACISVDGTPEISSLFAWIEIDTLNQDYTRRNFSCLTQVTLLEGWHDVCIVCGMNSNIAFVSSLSCNIEAIHIVN